MPSLGLGLKMLVPMPPMVTSRPMRSGFWMAKLMPTPPPIELPTMCTFSTPSASSKGETVPNAVDHRVTAEVVADPEAGEFQDQAAEVLGERGQYSAEVAPAGDTGAGAVQEQQHRAGIGAVVVVAQSALRGADFTQVVLGGRFRSIGHGCHPAMPSRPAGAVFP